MNKQINAHRDEIVKLEKQHQLRRFKAEVKKSRIEAKRIIQEDRRIKAQHRKEKLSRIKSRTISIGKKTKGGISRFRSIRFRR